ncbi:Putative PAS/PAC sensor histidine kinase [Nitrosotalea devaniterrae]|uniref:histidine kinase n=1 Tax=Nitrosotalea devaniterrae TaxID=1078905 RepID=A0A128A4E1_9ARCH|nr:Putative PAS/PAC sensor histidine kinase [Candidatus Nitrosotalea devanaterra]
MLEDIMAEFKTSSAQQLKKEIHKIKELEQKYHSLYDGSPILLRTIDLKGIIIDCNMLYADSLGYSKTEIIGKSIFDHVAKQSIGALTKSFKQWKKTGIVKSKEVWLQRKNGTKFPTLLSATNLYGSKNKLIGSNTALRDITEIHEAQEKIKSHELKMQEQLTQLKKLDALKDDFLTMITHELKTPLVPIMSYVDIMLSETFGKLNEEQKKRLEIIRTSTGSLLKLISDLLNTQKIELGQLVLHKDVHDLNKIIRGVVEKIKLHVDRNNIALAVDLERQVMVLCDDSRMDQVISNLILNSLDFCPKQNGKIDLKLYSEKNYAHVIVKDNGIGIIKENIGKIFVKFYQVDASTTREHGGTGVGLAVCKGLVEGHGGKIWAESKGRGKGTEIHILLPLAHK